MFDWVQVYFITVMKLMQIVAMLRLKDGENTNMIMSEYSNACCEDKRNGWRYEKSQEGEKPDRGIQQNSEKYVNQHFIIGAPLRNETQCLRAPVVLSLSGCLNYSPWQSVFRTYFPSAIGA